MEEVSKGKKSESDMASTTAEFRVSPRINNSPPPQRQKEPSAIQSKDATAQASGHRDARMHERHQALWRGVCRCQEEGIRDSKRRPESHSPSDVPSKKFRSDESNPRGLQMQMPAKFNNESNKPMPAKFLMTDEARKVEGKITAGPSIDRSEDGNIVLHKLFEKSLTPSDVGKLYRFVVPKKHAMEYFPDVMNTDKTVFLDFLDNQKARWKFRYCYWPSSQSFLLTRGWGQFVKEKGLDKKDVVVFYQFEEELDGRKNQHYMIDIRRSDSCSNKVILGENADEMIENHRPESSLDTTEKSMEEIPKKIPTGEHEGVEEAAEKWSTGERVAMKVQDQDRDEMSSVGSNEMNLEENSSEGKEEAEVTDMKQEKSKEGVWLFGVQILHDDRDKMVDGDGMLH